MSASSFLDYGFLVRALIAGVWLAVLCGVLSPFIVLRRMAFAADGLAHASLGGLAVGLFLLRSGPVPTAASYLISFVFTCGVALAIAYFARRVQSDTAIGVCYVAAFALGVTLLSLRQRGLGNLEHLFFGSILAVQSLELTLLAGLTGLAVSTCWLCWRWLGAWIFDEELARAEGVPVPVLRYSLMLLIAGTVIVATRVVGVLLVAAMLVLPGAVSCLAARQLWIIVLISVLTALVSTLSGIAVSNAVNVPPGPAIVLAAFGCFLAAFAGRRWRDRRAFHCSAAAIPP
jgi:zinc transport system permease protein